MRQIKFRAWDKEYGHMYQNAYPFEHLVYVEMHDDDETFEQFKHKMQVVNGKYFYFIIAKDIELMQFTGLQDRNGKDIYEGDILKAYPYGWEQPGQRVVFYAVVFSEFEGMWVLKDERPIEDCPSLYSGGIKSRKNERLEVIGNIYETLDLLAKEQ